MRRAVVLAALLAACSKSDDDAPALSPYAAQLVYKANDTIAAVARYGKELVVAAGTDVIHIHPDGHLVFASPTGDKVLGLTVDGLDLYAIQGGCDGSLHGGRIALDTNGALKPFVDPVICVAAVAGNNGRPYWLEYRTSADVTLRSIGPGREPRTLWEHDGVQWSRRLFVRGKSAVFSFATDDTNQIMRVPLDSGQPEIVASEPDGIRAIAVDTDGAVYWTSCPARGGCALKRTTGNPIELRHDARDLVVADGYLWWFDTSAHLLRRMKTSGGDDEVAVAGIDDEPANLSIADGLAVWTTRRTLWKAKLPPRAAPR